MSDVESLYRAILASPADDTLRLVYADAVEESGDEARAAFVRQQVELARLPFYDAKRIEARYFLSAAPDAEGLCSAPLPEGVRWAQNAFRRGLPGAVFADAEALLRGADELFARYPIEALELGVLRLLEAGSLAECEWLARVRELNLTIGAGAQAVARLFDSPHFTALADLRVGSELSTPPALAAMVRSRAFAGVTSLTVRNDRRAGGSIAGELARYSGPARLEKLDASGNRLDADALEPLLAAPALARVAELNLSNNALDEPGARVLSAAELPHLRALSLNFARPVDAEVGTAALVRARYLPTLRALALNFSYVTANCAEALAQAPLGELRSLKLFGNRVGDRGAEALARSAALGGLLELDLSDSRVGDAGALALAESPHLGGLLFLNLLGDPLGPRAAGALRDRFSARARFKAE
jgi:uncharacterized protein (TIGR02996 family)